MEYNLKTSFLIHKCCSNWVRSSDRKPLSSTWTNKNKTHTKPWSSHTHKSKRDKNLCNKHSNQSLNNPPYFFLFLYKFSNVLSTKTCYPPFLMKKTLTDSYITDQDCLIGLNMSLPKNTKRKRTICKPLVTRSINFMD